MSDSLIASKFIFVRLENSALSILNLKHHSPFTCWATHWELVFVERSTPLGEVAHRSGMSKKLIDFLPPWLPLLCNSTNWILSADTFRPLTSARFNLATKINDWQLDNCRNVELQWHFRFICQSHVTFGQDRISRLYGAVISFKRNWELGLGISQSRAAVARVWVSVSFVTKGYFFDAVWHWHYTALWCPYFLHLKCHNSYEIYVSSVAIVGKKVSWLIDCARISWHLWLWQRAKGCLAHIWTIWETPSATWKLLRNFLANFHYLPDNNERNWTSRDFKLCFYSER